MKTHQPGILANVPKQARYLFFSEIPKADLAPALRFLQDHVDGESAVLGLGHSVSEKLESNIPGLKNFSSPSGAKVNIPATPFSLFIWLRGGDRGELLHRSRAIENGLAGAFVLTEFADSFMYKEGRDLTGYEDGTENPKGKKAAEAAFVFGGGPGLEGSSFLAVQRWVHDLNVFDSMGQKDRDHSIGRRVKDNVEIANAPPSAHVKRTAQENFTPESFVLRRSMPWSDGKFSGLIFTAFGKSFDAFEAQLRRMSGAEDGITDALFRFTKPISTAYFWCPPMHKGKIDLRALTADSFRPIHRKPMATKQPNPIDKYILGFPKETQDILQKIRATIQKSAPKAEETISYAIPAFKLNGVYLVFFAGYKKHIGFYATPTGHKEFKDELSLYKQGKGSVQFPLDKPIPYGLIKKIVVFRAKESNKKP